MNNRFEIYNDHGYVGDNAEADNRLKLVIWKAIINSIVGFARGSSFIKAEASSTYCERGQRPPGVPKIHDTTHRSLLDNNICTKCKEEDTYPKSRVSGKRP